MAGVKFSALVSALALVALVGVASAYLESTVKVHVTDQNGRPLEGVRIDYASAFPCSVGRYTQYTDSGGDTEAPFSCAYGATTITATANKYGLTASSTVTATGTPVISLMLTGYNLGVTVRDQKGRAYSNASVSISSTTTGTISATTGADGKARIETLPSGVPLMAKAEVAGAQNQTSVTLSQDQEVELTLPAYDFTVHAIKDDGSPLQGAVVSVAGPAGYGGMRNTDSSGAADFQQIPPGQVNVLLSFGNFNASKSATLSADGEIAVVMDVNAPTISEVAYTVPKPATPINITASVQDAGANASGVSRAALYYSTDSGSNWRQIPMSQSGGAYVAIMPPQSNGTIVMLKVEALDVAGNSINSSEAQFIVSEEAQGTSGPSGGGGMCGGGFILLGLATAAFLPLLARAYSK